MSPHNIHVTGHIRYHETTKIFCLFNFSDRDAYLSWYAFREKGCKAGLQLQDLWSGSKYKIGADDQHLVLKPYQFVLLKID